MSILLYRRRRPLFSKTMKVGKCCAAVAGVPLLECLASWRNDCFETGSFPCAFFCSLPTERNPSACTNLAILSFGMSFSPDPPVMVDIELSSSESDRTRRIFLLLGKSTNKHCPGRWSSSLSMFEGAHRVLEWATFTRLSINATPTLWQAPVSWWGENISWFMVLGWLADYAEPARDAPGLGTVPAGSTAFRCDVLSSN